MLNNKRKCVNHEIMLDIRKCFFLGGAGEVEGLGWDRMEVICCHDKSHYVAKLKDQYPVTAHAPNFDFLTGCREFKRCEK